MSVVDSMVIDGIALTEDKNGIVLLITDHLDWSEEYQHLMILQEKINMYLGYLEEKQYGDMYKEETITYGIIEIHFLYSLTDNAEKFLQAVQNQVAQHGIRIQYYVSEEEWDEIRQGAEKELRNLIVAYAKKLGYKARQNTIFRVKDAAMVYCDFLVVDSKKLVYRVNIKNYDYDDIFGR